MNFTNTNVLFTVILASILIFGCQHDKKRNFQNAGSENESMISANTKTVFEDTLLFQNSQGVLVLEDLYNHPSETESMISTNTKIVFEDTLLLQNSQGVLVLEDLYNHPSETDTITIYNSDHTIFRKFSFKPETENQEYYDYLDKQTSDLKLYAYHPDYNLFHLLANVSETDYSIYTKDEKEKYIRKSDQKFKFYTWKEYIMEPMANLSFNDFYNKITDTLPRIKSENVEYGDFLAKPLQFHNEWLQVVIIEITEDNRLIPKDTLWTRWRKGDNITLHFQYLD